MELLSELPSTENIHSLSIKKVYRTGASMAALLAVSHPYHSQYPATTDGQQHVFWKCQGLNPGPHACQASALPPSLSPRIVFSIIHFKLMTQCSLWVRMDLLLSSLPGLQELFCLEDQYLMDFRRKCSKPQCKWPKGLWLYSEHRAGVIWVRNVPHSIGDVNIWSLVCGTVREGFRGAALLEEACYWGGLGEWKSSHHFQFSLCFTLTIEDVSSQVPALTLHLLLWPHLTLADMPPCLDGFLSL